MVTFFPFLFLFSMRLFISPPLKIHFSLILSSLFKVQAQVLLYSLISNGFSLNSSTLIFFTNPQLRPYIHSSDDQMLIATVISILLLHFHLPSFLFHLLLLRVTQLTTLFIISIIFFIKHLQTASHFF